MRDLVAMVAMLFFAYLGCRNTFIAYMLWGWAGLVSINAYMFGFMAGIPLVQIFALICLTRLLLFKEASVGRFQFSRTSIIMLMLGLQVLLSAIFAYDNLPRNWEACGNLMKTLLFCLVMPSIVTTRKRVYCMVVMIALGLSFHGMLDGLKFIASGGTHNATGVKFGDNNYYAMVLATVIPFLYYLGRYSESKLARLGISGIMALTVLAIIATKSRGGLLCLVAIGLWIVLNGNKKIAGIFTLVAVATMIIALAPESWFERMNTMKNASEDNSFMVRVGVWKKSTAIALENPILGGGLFAVQAPVLYEKFKNAQGLMGFIDTPEAGLFAAHSIYFQVLGDLGFVGLLIYVALLLNIFSTRRDIKNILRARGQKVHWGGDLADMLAASTLSFMVGGALLSAAYLEVPYLSFMLIEVLKYAVKHEDNSPAGVSNPDLRVA